MNKLYKQIDTNVDFRIKYGSYLNFTSSEKNDIEHYVFNMLSNKNLTPLDSHNFNDKIEILYTSYSNSLIYESTIFIEKLHDDYFILNKSFVSDIRSDTYCRTQVFSSRFICDGIDGLHSCINNEIGIQYE